MNWLNILAVLACPLMMVLCMGGMFMGKKENGGKKASVEQTGSSEQELQSLQIQMADLIEQNHHLAREIQSLKQSEAVGNTLSKIRAVK